MRTGLVLEGGGMRGLFTAGVLDVMMERGIKVDGIVGVSAGACFGCNYVSNQPGRVLRYNMMLKDDPRYMGLRSLIRTGNLLGAEFAYHTLPDILDPFDKQAFAQSPVEFHVVCTDVYTGTPVYKQLKAPVDYEFMEWIRASSALPLVSHPVEIMGGCQEDGRHERHQEEGCKGLQDKQCKGRKYERCEDCQDKRYDSPRDGRCECHHLLLDGGISDSIPLQYFQRLGYDHNIVVLTQPKGFTKQRTRLMPLFRLFMRKYPAIIHAMERRHLMYNAQLEYLAHEEQSGRITVIAPEDTLPIGRTSQNPTRMQHVYHMGRHAAEKAFL